MINLPFKPLQGLDARVSRREWEALDNVLVQCPFCLHHLTFGKKMVNWSVTCICGAQVVHKPDDERYIMWLPAAEPELLKEWVREKQLQN